MSDILLPPPVGVLQQALGSNKISIKWLAGDGSDRCYYRIEDDSKKCSYVLMKLSSKDAQLLSEGKYEWVILSYLLSTYHIRVPKSIKLIPEYASLIIEDYGDMMLETYVYQNYPNNKTGVQSIFYKAIKIYLNFLEIPYDGSLWCQRKFDEEKFSWELNFFIKHYYNDILGLFLTNEEKKVFDQEVQELSALISVNSKYFVHRDFHSRNLMLKDNELAVIDFQDARLGPPSYDLVSIVFDNYLPFNIEEKTMIFSECLKLIKNTLPSEIYDQVTKEYPYVLLQRQLKAIGSYGYLTKKKQKRDYLCYVPQAIESIKRVLKDDSRFSFLSSVIIEKIEERLNDKS